MVQPIDYLGALPQVDLGQSLLSGIKTGAAIRGLREQSAEREKAAAQQAQAEADLRDYFADPTPRKAALLPVKYPQLREAFKQSQDILSEEQKGAEFGTGMRVYSALHQRRPEFALQILDESITAMKNSGQDTADLESIRASIERDPDSAIGPVGLVLAGINPEGFDKAVSSFAAVQKAPLEVRKAGAEATKAEAEAGVAGDVAVLGAEEKAANIQNVRSQIQDRTARLAADRQAAGQISLDKDSKKLLNDSVSASIASDQAASRALELASQLEKEGGGFGVASTAGEWFKRATGNQDAMSALRKEYVRLRNAQAIKDLPPGVATDKDVALALEGFPDASADASTIASFLRGTAKMNQVAAVSENARAEWVNEVGHTGRTKRDIVIDGVSVPGGTTFVEFTRSYVPQKVGQRGAEQSQQQIPNRSYMRFANPGAK